jgi:hypothetical protein
MAASDTIVGVISDTHGLIRPQAVTALAGSDLIIHAGDVGKPGVLERLRELAPTFAVRGNIDMGDWAEGLPLTQTIEAGALRLFVLHEIAQLDLDPASAGFAAVLFGHSHRPLIDTRGGILFLNPGSAGPRRFRLPITIARIRVSDRQMRAQIVELRV